MRIDWIDNDPQVSVYQSRAYGEATALTTDARWDVIGDPAGRWRMPICILSTPDGEWRDAVSPYGYPGIFADRDMSAEDADGAWAQTIKVLSDSGIVSLFLRFAPYRDGIETRQQFPGLTVTDLSETILVSLSEEAQMWEGMQGRSRTAVRKAEREGLRARVVEGARFSLQRDNGFRHVYETAMRRVDASASHLHGDEYYSILTESPDVDLHVLEVTDREGAVVAATLLLVDQEAVHYHLSGSLMSAAKTGANNLMLWTAMCWAAAGGHQRFHLGGGTSRADGLFKFKASFGGDTRPFNVGRVVVRPDEYDRLVVARSRELGVPVETLTATPYFPAYRSGMA